MTPRMNFDALPLAMPLQTVLGELGLTELTPVQQQAIPPLLEGQDVLGRSHTGSGKTAAFALPLLHRLRLSPRRLQALVICPTRELAAQVAREMRRLGRRLAGLQVLVTAGGEPARLQVSALSRGVHVVVGTPGRVLDLLGRRALDASLLELVVLDEADRMLDMGFRDDLVKILAATRRDRQTALFSATFPDEVEKLASTLLRDPVRVVVEETEVAADIRQVVYETTPEARTRLLVDVLRHHRPPSAIVFCNQKAAVTEVASALRSARISADGLQGDLEQAQRDQALAKFRNLTTRVLVATDVAARGLDVASVALVVNFQMAQSSDAHVHRTGRTGRAGREGLAVSFVTPAESARLEAIEQALGKLPRETPPVGVDEAPLEAPMRTLFIGEGRKDKLRPGDIVGALTGQSGGLPASVLGKIELHDRHAWVAVAKEDAHTALERLRAGGIKGRRQRVELVR